MPRLLQSFSIAVGLHAPYVLVNGFCITGLGLWAISGVEVLLVLTILVAGCYGLGGLLVLAFRPQQGRRASTHSRLGVLP